MHWGRYASVLVISGGSGAAFGCLAGRNGRFLGRHPGGWDVGLPGAWVMQRMRFVWLVREFAHIQVITTIVLDEAEESLY